MEKQERVCIGIEWRRGWGQRVVVMRDYISAQVLFLFTYFLLQVEYLYLLVYETLDTLASKRSALPLFPPLFLPLGLDMVHTSTEYKSDATILFFPPAGSFSSTWMLNSNNR